MKRNVLTRMICVAVLAVVACGGSSLAASEMPRADGQALLDFLKTSDYQSWSLFPGKGKLYEGRHPHGAFLTTYVSKDALAAIEAKKGMLPVGAILVKENYSPEKKLAAITAMYRVKGYDAEAGDWFWAKYATDGKILAEGKVKGCINCHQAVLVNDWIFTGPVK